MSDATIQLRRLTKLEHVDWSGFLRRYGALIVLVLLVIFNIIFTENFLTVQNLLYVQLRQATSVALLAIGMSMVIATGGIDLSVGAIVALSGQTTAAIVLAGGNVGVGLVVGMLVAVLCGVFNGTLVSAFGVQPMIATLILFTAGRGIAQVVTGGRIAGVDDPVIRFIGLGAIAGIPLQVVILALIAAITIIAGKATRLGTMLIAVGGNEKASSLVGIRTKRVKMFAYVVAGGIAGIVGMLELGRIQASDATNAGLLMELDAIAAVAVAGASLAGGGFTPGRAVIGAIMLRLLQNTLIAHGISREISWVVQGAIIVVAILLQRKAKGSR